ncbi:MAG: hypothetical protein IPJ33_04470 [Gammaproteobacteria bacterium]|nr:hypothetical protein [Gammaproteobacteria bacterium]
MRSATIPFTGSNWVYTDTTFDSAGRARHQSQPYYNNGSAYWSTKSYDELGRLTQLIDPKGGVTTTTYTGLFTEVTNPASQRRKEERNYLGEVVKVSDHLALTGTTGATIENGYDATGNLVQVQLKTAGSNRATGVPSTITTSIGYDAWGRKTSLNDPDKGAWTYTYNAFDELIKQIDAKGQRSELTYESAGRLVARSDFRADGTRESDTVWAVDINGFFPATVPGRQLGLIQSLKDAAGTSQVGSVVRINNYDAWKRPIGTTVALDGGANYTDTVEYDSIGRVLKRLDSSGAGRGVEYVYNANGYQSEIKEASTGVAYSTVQGMDAYGNVTTEQLGTGASPRITTRSFEPQRGLAVTIKTAYSGGANDIQDLTFTWDLVGNLMSRQDKGGSRNVTEAFTYDELNRLRTVKLGATTTDTLTFDAFGNIKTKTGVGTYSYLSARPHAVTATSSGNKTYSYDLNGNLVDGNGRALVYATFDKPVSASKGTTQVDYRYGPDRNVYKRVDTSNSVATTTWMVGGIEIVEKSDGSSDIRRYIDGVAEVVLHKNAGGTITGTDTRYLLRDHLGGVVGFVNGTAIDVDLGFDAWGCREEPGWSATCMSTTSSATFTKITGLTRRGFTGHQQADELELIHMNGRTYDTRLGRFMQADIVIQSPFDTQSYNRYSYLTNNPLNGTDPSGYFSRRDLKEYAGVIVGGALLAWNPLGYGIWQSAVYGAIAGGAGAAVNGGNVLQGVAIGAFSAAAFAGFDGAGFGWGAAGNVGQHALNIGASGVLGGAITVMQGGRFGHGFASAGVSAAAVGGMNGAGIKGPARVIGAAIAGEPRV